MEERQSSIPDDRGARRDASRASDAFWRRFGGAMGFLAVALGAFGAHGLKPLLTENGTAAIWDTASLYHLAHAVAMLMPWRGRGGLWRPACWFLIGMAVFSGSLYVLALTGAKWLGMITPLGGVAFLIGWLCFAISRDPECGRDDQRLQK